MSTDPLRTSPLDTDPYQVLLRKSHYVLGSKEKVPRVGIILGTGLSALREEVTSAGVFPFNDLFNDVRDLKAPSHKGEMVLGEINKVPVVLMDGRIHYYEGYTMAQVVAPVRLMKLLGVETLIITSAVGGLGWSFDGASPQKEGDIVVLSDHLNLMGDSPLRGPNIEELGPRFPDMTFPYDYALRDEAQGIYYQMYDEILHEVTYAAVAGPQLETLAEYRMLADKGADVVGMSVVPEVIAAKHMGMKVLALSVITDVVNHAEPKVATIENIIAAANGAAPKLRTIILSLLDGMVKA